MSLLRINDLFERIDMRSALLLLPDINEVLSMVGQVNPMKSRVELMKKSLEKFSHQVPLIRMSRMNINTNQYQFNVNNFDLYATNQIPVLDVIMIPTRIISLNGTIGGSRRQWVYQDNILNSWITGDVLVNALYRQRPYYVAYGNDDKLDPKASIGFIEERYESLFIDQCLLDILEFFNQLNTNFDYPDLPIQLFGGISEKISELRSELEYSYSGITHGKLYR